MIPPIADRYDIRFHAENYFRRTGNAVEIGVFRGEFSAYNLAVWQGRYFMVDAWQHRPGDGTDKNDKDAGHWSEVAKAASENTAFAGPRRELIKSLSTEAAQRFADGFFDWVYIDAGHDYQNCLNDLEAWWPKLRPGGLFSGDDYGLSEHDQRLAPVTPERWATAYGNVAMAYKWGTAPALHTFCAKHGAELHVTWMNDFFNPAWYIVKKITQ